MKACDHLNKRNIGSRYEQIAADYLKEKGYRILEMNFRQRQSEIDLIAMDHHYIVFTEVKYRSDHSYGYAGEAVDYRKQQKLKKAAVYYLYKNHMNDCPCRFDVVAIHGDQITHYINAFE